MAHIYCTSYYFPRDNNNCLHLPLNLARTFEYPAKRRGIEYAGWARDDASREHIRRIKKDSEGSVTSTHRFGGPRRESEKKLFSSAFSREGSACLRRVPSQARVARCFLVERWRALRV